MNRRIGSRSSNHASTPPRLLVLPAFAAITRSVRGPGSARPALAGTLTSRDLCCDGRTASASFRRQYGLGTRVLQQQHEELRRPRVARIAPDRVNVFGALVVGLSGRQ